MKRTILYIGSLLFSLAGLQSCLDYTEVGSEFDLDQSQGSLEVFHGQVDIIDYRKEITEAGFDEASSALTSYFGQSVTAQYIMRGGKEGAMPAAHAYQRVYSLGPDNYAQYSTVSHKDFMYGTLTSTYAISDDFNTGPHFMYSGSKNYLMALLNHPKIDSIPEMKAINLLYYCLAAQEMADLSGPFTYLEDKTNAEEPTIYNDLRTIYYGIEDNLDTIVACLKHFENRPEWYKTKVQGLIEQYCKTQNKSGYQGVGPYIKLANSLKMRMAMHIVKVEPETAEKWYKEAAESGVMTEVNDQLGLYPTVLGFAHPLVEIAATWGDTNLSASFESLLVSLNHPYKDYLFTKNTNPIVNALTGETTATGTRLCGIRGGTLVGDGQTYPTNPLAAYSHIDKDYFPDCPLYLMKLAEVLFLRAEGALRGWETDGDAEYFYEQGIRNADCDEPTYWTTSYASPYQKKVEEYMSLENPVEYVQVDPVGGGEDWPSVTKIGVKWNNADPLETKLEKIITQKYIALFPNSFEAWTEMRRTGYPKVFPILNTDDGDGSIDQGDMIRRIPWAATDPRVQENISATGLDALGGDDFQATRLWWDVDAPNF